MVKIIQEVIAMLNVNNYSISSYHINGHSLPLYNNNKDVGIISNDNLSFINNNIIYIYNK